MKKQINNIFILTTDPRKIKAFFKFYNVYDKETQTQINLIIDDRVSLESKFNFDCPIYKVTDIIDYCSSELNSNNLLKILSIYPVSVKLLIFLWAFKFLNIEKSMLIDDDTVLIKPIDKYFEFDYVVKGDNIQGVNENIVRLMDSIFDCQFSEFVNANELISSGQLIFTYNEIIFEIVKKFFSSDEVLSYIEALIIENKLFQLDRNAPYKNWLMEQYMHGFILYRLRKSGQKINFFEKDVKIIFSENFYFTSGNIPSFIHFGPANKSYFYKTFLPKLKKLL